MSRKLFMSFTALLREWKKETVTEADLGTGLYYFACSRAHALDPWMHPVSVEPMWFYEEKEAREVHALIAAAILKAEEEGRVAWRGENTYEELNAMFIANGMESLKAADASISYGELREMIAEAGLEIEVVY